MVVCIKFDIKAKTVQRLWIWMWIVYCLALKLDIARVHNIITFFRVNVDSLPVVCRSSGSAGYLLPLRVFAARMGQLLTPFTRVFRTDERCC